MGSGFAPPAMNNIGLGVDSYDPPELVAPDKDLMIDTSCDLERDRGEQQSLDDEEAQA